jgi:hypothetical protein
MTLLRMLRASTLMTLAGSLHELVRAVSYVCPVAVAFVCDGAAPILSTHRGWVVLASRQLEYSC